MICTRSTEEIGGQAKEHMYPEHLGLNPVRLNSDFCKTSVLFLATKYTVIFYINHRLIGPEKMFMVFKLPHILEHSVLGINMHKNVQYAKFDGLNLMFVIC